MTRMRITTATPGQRAAARRRHDAPRSAGCALPNPMLTASGCAAAGRELDQFFDVDRARRGRHQVDHAAAAVRPADAADGRDAQRDAQLDRPAGPGHRRLPRQRPGLAASTAAPAPSCPSPAAASTSTPSSRSGCATPTASPRVEVNISCPNVEDRGQVFACDPAAAAAVIAAVRRSTTARACRSSPSSRPTSPTSSRSPRPCVDAGADGLSMINTTARHGHRPRHDAAGARRRHRRPVRPGDPADRGALRLAGARRRCPTSRSSAWAASVPASTRSSSCSPARRRSSVGTVLFNDPSAPVRVAARAARSRWPTAASTGFADAVGLRPPAARRPPVGRSRRRRRRGRRLAAADEVDA